MGRILFTSDLHFGHKNVIKYDKRPFENIQEMDEEIIIRWNKKVNKDDIIYILGDISWYKDEKTAELLSRLNGKIILVKGNHDKIGPLTRRYISQIYDYLEINVDDKRVVLSHYPIHFFNHHHHNAIMLHGHVHNSKEAEYVLKYRDFLRSEGLVCNLYNVGCMEWNYEPVTLEEILDTDSEKTL